jgi:two-component system chemotaxis response regulator CheY
MTARCVLVVDDERDLREGIAECLELEGYLVKQARNGREALDLVAASLPAIILLDLMMPVMSGWQVMDALRASPTLSAIPIIVISAAHQLPSGVSVVSKPFRFEDLLQRMKAVLGEA